MNPLPKETKVAIARSYFAGTKCADVAREFGIQPAHVLMIAKRYDRDRYQSRVGRQSRLREVPKGPVLGAREHGEESKLWIDRDAAQLAAFIPSDTRTLTGVLLGDPLPGRSALDQRPAR